MSEKSVELEGRVDPLPLWWQGVLVAMILLAAVAVLLPGARTSPVLMIASVVIVPVWFIATLMRERRRGGNLSIGQIHAEARKGRRFRHHPLENAAMIALLLIGFMAMIR